MLGKLFKHDFKSIIRFWWIAAIAVTSLSVVSGFVFTIINSDKTFPVGVYTVLYLVLMLMYFAFIAFSILTLVSIFIRFYKNFFSDEGYLTFTLPVKKTQLLNSKILSGLLLETLTGTVIFVDALIIICITFREQIFTVKFIRDFISGITKFFSDLTAIDVVYLVTWIIEVIIIGILVSIISVLLLYICITLGSVVTRKARVVVAIAIYYGATNVTAFISAVLYLFGFESALVWLTYIPEATGDIIITLVLLAIILLMSSICTLMYTLEYKMLDKKLNLS